MRNQRKQDLKKCKVFVVLLVSLLNRRKGTRIGIVTSLNLYNLDEEEEPIENGVEENNEQEEEPMENLEEEENNSANTRTGNNTRINGRPC